jgi:putative tryptophan/tyrosine transport system substrate-binding protein
MRRRELIAFLAGVGAAWPLGVAAQSSRQPTIGFLGSGTLGSQGQWVAAFLRRLRELGWIDGRNVTIEYRWAEGSSDRAAELAADLARIKADVIVTYANPIVLAAKRASNNTDGLCGGSRSARYRPRRSAGCLRFMNRRRVRRSVIT